MCMIAGYWGHKIDVSGLRRRFAVSLKGMSLKSLMTMAQHTNFHVRPVKLDMQHLRELKLPCILHWDLNHFVVLKTISANSAIIHDPGIGVRRLPFCEVAQHFTGIALELTPSEQFVKRKETQEFSLTLLVGRVIGLKRNLSQILLLGLAMQAFSLLVPFHMQWLVDEALVSGDRDLITVLGLGFCLLVLVQAAIGGVRSWVTTTLAASLNLQWLGNAFAHLMKLPLSYFEKRHSGDIISRFASIQTMQRSMTTQFVEGVIDGVLVIGTFTMMLTYSPRLTVVASVAVFLYVLLRLVIYKPLRDASAEQILHAAKQQTHFIESVRNAQSIRLFARSHERMTAWTNALADQFNANLRVDKLTVTSQTLNSLIFGTERVIIVWMAGLSVLNREFSVGMLFAFISYKDQFSQRLASLVDKLFELRMMRLHGERVADIVLTAPEGEQQGGEIDVDRLVPSIELRNVSFRYADGEPNIISGLTLAIPAGQCVAITGPSGCGKTTLIKLILGLIEPAEGEILVGGVSLQQIGIKNFRSIASAVMQEDALFSGSIEDNICFFDPEPQHELMKECARQAAMHTEVLEMPMGYQSLVGDIGTGLSGGQKQRILLARALYKNPKILFLDEATSHLDIWNEQAVNAEIAKLKLTRIVVAHRPETISMAERIIVLQNGKLVQDIAAHEVSAAA